MGIHAYRFSVSWPRIYPLGKGDVNIKGLDHYDKLVDSLLAAGISPYVTLFHWDLPQALEDDGGWPNRATADHFAEYARTVADRIGDRVSHWMTVNEPWAICFMGYRDGVHAPGRRDEKAAFEAVYTVCLAHGKGYEAIKASSPNASVGLTHVNLNFHSVARDGTAEKTVAREDALNNGVFLDPIVRGIYPDIVLKEKPELVPDLQPDDFEKMNQYDFLGLQYYCDQILVGGGDRARYLRNEPVPFYEYSEMGWPITPVGLYEQIMHWTHDYNIDDIFITENGSAWQDVLSPDGRVRDAKRVDYLERHLAQVHRAIEEGAPVKGYFAWSFMDNFEWAKGYRPRFGIVYTDYATQNRYIKESGHTYSRIIKANGIC